MTEPIFLLGFMGSGKSYWGRRLSATLEMPFYDLDAYIVTQTGKSIPELFAEHGEAGFRKMEQAHLRSLMEQSASVVSTGGGTPCFFDNMEQMNRFGRTIYLQVPVEILAARLSKEMHRRPLLAGLNSEDLPDFIKNLLEKRAPFYELAQQKPEWSGVEAVYFKRILEATTLIKL